MKKRRFSEIALLDDTSKHVVKIRSYTSIPFDIAITHGSTRASDGRIVLSKVETCSAAHVANIQQKHTRADFTKEIPCIQEQDDAAVRKAFTRIHKCFTKPFMLCAHYLKADNVGKRTIRITFQVNVIWREDLEAFGKDESGTIFPKDDALVVTYDIPASSPVVPSSPPP